MHSLAFADSIQPLVRADRALVVDSDFALEDGVWLESFPSHTPGNVVVNIRSMSSRLSRGVIATGCVTLSGVAMILLSKSTGLLEQIPLVMLAFAVCSVTYALGPPLIGEISPVHQRGAMLGINNGIFSTAGLIAPWLMGHIVDVGINPSRGFREGFMFAGLLIVVGGAVSLLLINPESDLARFKQRNTAILETEAPAH